MEYEDKNIKPDCVLSNINKLPITIITGIFAYSSNSPSQFISLISKSKKMQEIIFNVLSRINPKNEFNPKSNEFILKYKLSQNIYLTLLENTISKKIKNLPLKLPLLDEEDLKNNEFLKIIYNSFIKIFDKYQSLNVFYNDTTFNKKRNKWYLKKTSEMHEKYSNNCIFIVNNVEDIESIISLLYYNNYLNYKTTLTINKITDEYIKKIVFEDEKINYYMEYPRSIILKRQFISQLLKLNINFYICSKENIYHLKNITFQSINDYKNKNLKFRKKLSMDYSSSKNINNIISNLNNSNNILIDNNKSSKSSQIIINKQNISFKEINTCLKDFESFDNIKTLVFQNILIENSFFKSLFTKYKSNNTINYNNYETKNIKNNSFLKFNKNIFDNNILIFNFEKDFFEVNINDKITILNCSELINYINNYKFSKNVYFLNFPLININSIENPFIENIYINNFFNLENRIILPINEIITKIPKLSKIYIKVKDFSNSIKFSFIRRNDLNINKVTLNLLDDNIGIDNCEIVDLNNIIIPKKIFSIIKSFKGINTFVFSFAKIKIYENSDNIDIVFNEDLNLEGIKKIDINLLQYLNFDNLIIYGHILNGLKTVKFYINNEDNDNDLFKNKDILDNSFIYDLISNNINSFSESNFSLFFIKNYFFVPFIEDIILKINNKELQKFLINCNNFSYKINLYDIDMNILYNIQNDYIKYLNIYLINYKYDFSFENKNKNEFNFRFIYNQIPSLRRIKLYLKNHKLCFKCSILPMICFDLYYEKNNKKKLIVDFEKNDLINTKLENKKVMDYIFNNCKGYIIFNINDKEFIHDKNGKIEKYFDIKDIIPKILIIFYIITLNIIILINFFNINY